MYLAFCRMSKEEPAGRTYFYEAAVEWKGCMRFHKKSTHQLCSTCSKLKAAIESAKAA